MNVDNFVADNESEAFQRRTGMRERFKPGVFTGATCVCDAYGIVRVATHVLRLQISCASMTNGVAKRGRFWSDRRCSGDGNGVSNGVKLRRHVWIVSGRDIRGSVEVSGPRDPFT